MTINSMTALARRAITGLTVGIMLCMPSAFAQEARGGAPAPAPANPNAMLTSLSQAVQANAIARKCNWAEPLYQLASESNAKLTEANLKSMLPATAHVTVDTALSQAAGSAAGFACMTPDGAPAPQRAKVEPFITDQYWRMMAHVDVLGSLRWGEVFHYTSEERTALDQEIARVKESKGYGYYEVANPLETLADKTVTLACRERPSNGKPCRPVPPEIEGNAPAIKVLIETTEAFGKAVAAEKIQENKSFLAAVGDLTNFSAIGDGTCTADALALKTSDALVNTQVTDSSLGAQTQQVMFVEKYRLGQPERVGWILLFRSMLFATDNDPYIVLAEDGGEWNEENARNGAGQVNQLSNAIMDDIESKNLSASMKQAAIANANASVIDTYFTNFVSMGLMQSLNGAGGIVLNECRAD